MKYPNIIRVRGFSQDQGLGVMVRVESRRVASEVSTMTGTLTARATRSCTRTSIPS